MIYVHMEAGSVAEFIDRLYQPAAQSFKTRLTDGASNLRAHVGPCELSEIGQQVAVRCPVVLEHILLAGAVWQLGSWRWLVQRRRIGGR